MQRTSCSSACSASAARTSRRSCSRARRRARRRSPCAPRSAPAAGASSPSSSPRRWCCRHWPRASASSAPRRRTMGEGEFHGSAERPPPFWWTSARARDAYLCRVLALLAAALVGIVPALKATGRAAGRCARPGLRRQHEVRRVWTGVIVAQVAITVIFLSRRVGRMDGGPQPGSGSVIFPREQLLTARSNPGTAVGGAIDRRHAAALTAGDARAGRHRGDLRDVAAGHDLRATQDRIPSKPGKRPPLPRRTKNSECCVTGRGRRRVAFFGTLGVSLVSGPLLRTLRFAGGRDVAIVDETFVRLVLGGRNPLGLSCASRPRWAVRRGHGTKSSGS